MKNNDIENVLNLIDLPKTEQTKGILSKILSQMENQVDYLLSKLEVLVNHLKHVKGYISISSSTDSLKITYDKESVSKEISKEFWEICDKWVDKYKIKTEYDFEKEVIYLK